LSVIILSRIHRAFISCAFCIKVRKS